MKAKTLRRAASAYAARGLAALLMLLDVVSIAHAAEIKVLSGMGMRAIMTALTESFERTTGHKLTIVYGTAGLMRDRVRDGEVTDVAIMQRYLLDDLQQRGRIAGGATVDIARSSIALFGRLDGPKPDISSIEGLKQALLDAKSITYTDPASGGLSGSHFAAVLQRLGIAEQMKAKTRLGRPTLLVPGGEVELGILQVSEILPLKGVQLIGRLPEQLQDNTPVSAAVVSGAQNPEAGMALVKFLSSPVAAQFIRTLGMEPIEQR